MLDRAIPPTDRTKPQRGLIVAAAGVLSLVIMSLMAIFIENARQKGNMEKTSPRIHEIVTLLRGDLRRITRPFSAK